MTILDLMHWLEQQPFAVAIAESGWLFPIFETAHVLALTVVVGSVAMMDLRLLGVGSRSRAISELTSSMLPWAWTAFSAAAICGFLLFASKATNYYDNLAFRIKVLCLVLAGVNMLVFHLVTARRMASWDRDDPPGHVKMAGVISLTLWVAIVATGRWIGFMP
jgi:uncharacterized membrane protein